MPCTTVLAGKDATNDRSTMICRTDDGRFDEKKLIVVSPKDQPKKYKSVLSHVEIDLPDEPLSYTACPSVDRSNGIWAATGINSANVGMTATETITSNPRVLAADPPVKYKKAEKRGEKDAPGGIGEEDILVLVLPYIRSAREGAERLGALLEKYGTYESNGVAFNDENEVWWLESIGGHHWIARKVPDDAVVLAPNQFGMDGFDLKDAFGARKENLCSKDLREFIKDNCLDLNQNGTFNPRDVFGSRTDRDHVYNTPRAWFMGRRLCPRSHTWDGDGAEFTPESDDIPWALVPDRKVTVEEIKYLVSSHYQGTPFDPYLKRDTGVRGKYRSIGINRTGVTTICQIRPGVPDEIKAVEWICFGSTAFASLIPFYAHTDSIPAYLSKVGLDVSTDNFYWNCRLIGVLADSHYFSCVQDIECYDNAMMTGSRAILNEYDRRFAESRDPALIKEANDKLCAMAKAQTAKVLGQLVYTASSEMKNGYDRSDS